MPGLVCKLLIFAAAIKIDYKGNVGPLLKDRRQEEMAPGTLEVHGIIGLLKIATSYFLISICDCEQVAQIRSKPSYKITNVALIPLSSQADADKAITSARDHV
ncbi:hypothetical protein DPSP01_011758 [Paraphaeosphaeria sporulosa]|uniref:SAC domain-containing protein n=1 Tax=Paraphaeosphaeria sporulosa TaxID=1460663 RepID=A0A177BW41_9PLEO|nr:uncharacterized protein CC84DRAFT_1223692 [Paraphaeosphaeria sporulosa]OAF98586.1 hypothetical protein CC84DRAFT_1223692 [Paraphaeosphaeria sporulosa]